MSTETELWIAIGFIFMQATFMYWVIRDNNKAFLKMSGQLDRLITILQEGILVDDESPPHLRSRG